MSKNQSALIKIQQVLRPSEQGVTRPYLCRATDSQLYWVKGKYAGIKEVTREWVAASIGKRLGLPIPDFGFAQVPAPLFASLDPSVQRALGEKPMFASRVVEAVQELRWSDVEAVPAELQRDVFLFDLWIVNGDRQLCAEGGNPNMLWNPERKELAVIDHNAAFGEDDLDFLAEAHAFQDARQHLSPSNWPQVVSRLDEVLDSTWPELWVAFPQDLEDSLPEGFKDQMHQVLTRHRHNPEPFWGLLRP